MHLITLSIQKVKFASIFKPQLIYLFHKKNAKDIIENYRPVSHLVQAGRLFEYAIHFQVLEQFTKIELFHENHHGSLANHSTATAVFNCLTHG